MDIAVFIAGVAVERLKIQTRQQYRQVAESVGEAIDRYDKAHKKPQRCTGDILCTVERARHKVDCIGKTPPFDQYARELGSVE